LIDRFHPASGSTPGQILVRVERVADQSAATLALGRARADIANLDGGWQSAPGLSPEDRNNPKFVSGVMTTPSGPFIWIDGGETPAELLATIPELIAQRLAEAGITDALLTSPTGGGPLLDRGPVLEQTYRAVVLRAYPPVPRRKRERGVLPGTWLEEAATWLRQGDPGDRREAMCQVSSVQFSVDLDKVLEFLESCKTQRTSATMVAGNLDRRIRGVGFLSSVTRAQSRASGWRTGERRRRTAGVLWRPSGDRPAPGECRLCLYQSRAHLRSIR